MLYIKYIADNKRKEGNNLFNDNPNTFYIQLHGIGHMVKDHLDNEGGKLPISSKGSFICTISQTGYFSFQPVLHDWCNKGRGMCYPVCGMVHIKEP